MMSGNRTHEQAIYKILPILVVKVHHRAVPGGICAESAVNCDTSAPTDVLCRLLGGSGGPLRYNNKGRRTNTKNYFEREFAYGSSTYI